MKIIFLDFDGVISTAEQSWKLDKEKLDLLKNILDKTNSKIVVTSSWKRVFKDKDSFIESLKNNHRFTCIDTSKYEWFIDSIIDITNGSASWRGDEVKEWLDNNEIENYVILDDDTDFLDEQLFNFVQTDTYEGLTSREVKLCISILNGEKILNPIRLNSVLGFRWRLKYSIDKGEDIDRLLLKYRSL